ncbi:MAG: hypothetical protein AAGC47_04410 [Bacteroidota bacterium]
MDSKTEIIEPWHFWKLISFRFILIYFFLRSSLWAFIPVVGMYLYKFYYFPSLFLQNYILKWNDPYRWEHPPSGSGDTLDDWMLGVAYLLLSFILTLIWSLIDRRRKEHDILHNYFTVVLRYYLAMIMFSYGISKLFVNQMLYPSLAQFYTPLGEFTPMRFTWMYLGYSAPYQFFGGLMETLGGLLILFRRTQLLGLLVLLGVMGNVFLLNLFYGVPVKLFSFFLILIILYLLFQYRQPLINLLFNRPTSPVIVPNQFKTGWKRYLRITLKVAFIGYYFCYAFYQDYQYSSELKDVPPLQIEGAWDVERFTKNQEEITSPTDTTRWNRIVISKRFSAGRGRGHITCGTSNFKPVNFELDSTMQLSVTPKYQDEYQLFSGSVVQKNEDQFFWKGTSGNDTLEIWLRRNQHEFTLDKRKFMWVMETKDFY